MNLFIFLSSNNRSQKVKVDDERYIDVQNMVQRRFDDPSKTRNVKREEVEVAWYWKVALKIHIDNQCRTKTGSNTRKK